MVRTSSAVVTSLGRSPRTRSMSSATRLVSLWVFGNEIGKDSDSIVGRNRFVTFWQVDVGSHKVQRRAKLVRCVLRQSTLHRLGVSNCGERMLKGAYQDPKLIASPRLRMRRGIGVGCECSDGVREMVNRSADGGGKHQAKKCGRGRCLTTSRPRRFLSVPSEVSTSLLLRATTIAPRRPRLVVRTR